LFLGVTVTTAEFALEEAVESWDAQRMLQSLSEQIHRLAPDDCCIHGEKFCLSCGINWSVSQEVPLRFDSDGYGAVS
jgi:hypothetical protein